MAGDAANDKANSKANNNPIDTEWRLKIAAAAWMRFDLLDQPDAALQASRLVEQGSPALAPLMRQYRALATPAERRHLMLVGAVKYGISPVVGFGPALDKAVPRGEEEALADLWCNIPGNAGANNYDDLWNTSVEMAPPPADTSHGNGAARDSEIARLGALKTATGYIGEHVLQRAAAVPKDPDLPWLLHVVVQSTRGGCLDDNAKALSKKAFTLLHTRYGNTEWAKKTPYFY